MVKPAAKREVVKYLLGSFKVSIERCCGEMNLHRSMWYYQSNKDDTEVIDKLNELAEQLSTRGFDEYYGRIRKQDLKWNRKQVLRVYRNMKLGLRRIRNRRLQVTMHKHRSIPVNAVSRWFLINV